MAKSTPKPKLKIKHPIAPLTGNSFTYFLPRSSSSQTIHIKTVGKNGLLDYRKPGLFIKANFSEVNKLTLHHTGFLPSKSVLRGIDIMRAALEGGYGRLNLWTSDLAMNPTEASDLAHYLLSRLALVTSCLFRGANNTIAVRAVYAHIETSEKSALSFIIGGLGSYIAAQQWLKTGGDSLDLFLHAGIYTKALNGVGPLVNFAASSQKSPDYLVYTGKKDWHVFESKGGSIDGRWLRIVQGLAQLNNLRRIFWIGKTFPRSVRTAVCVHTSVDANEALKITVVDPPGENEGADEGAVGLIESVCNLLLVLEAIDQFRGLVGRSSTHKVGYGETAWLLSDSDVFGEFVVGIPSRYFDNELKIRRVVGIYLSAAESYSASNSVDNFRIGFRRKLFGVLRLNGNSTSERLSRAIDFYMQRIVQLFYQPDFLLRTSKVLRMEAISTRVMISGEEKVFARLSSEAETLITSGGMLIYAGTLMRAQHEIDS
jgi:hypothetical protein